MNIVSRVVVLLMIVLRLLVVPQYLLSCSFSKKKFFSWVQVVQYKDYTSQTLVSGCGHMTKY